MAKNISITIKKRNNIKIFSPRDLIISTEQRKKRKAKYARYKIFRLAQNLITTQYERKGEGEKRKKKGTKKYLKKSARIQRKKRRHKQSRSKIHSREDTLHRFANRRVHSLVLTYPSIHEIEFS